MQRARSARVRTAALTTTVGLCLVIPLAAASADSRSKSSSADGSSVVVAPVPSGSYAFGNGVDPDAPAGADAVKQLLAGTNSPGAKGSSSPTGKPAPAATTVPGGPAAVPAPTATASTAVANTVCGKAVEAPGGVRAQTCVVREGGEVSARVHYRNPTAEPLALVLVLMRPDNGTIEMRCTVDAGAGDGQCETPGLRTDQPLSAWSAIAEIATADASRKVLRSGTASAE
ncbi:hypothetical protein LO772_17495 [Yinghuangia sp. ASG 101]|uniref:hypothetical protein n=1 Tax=Yinghuangia sp. ASG 101 TaxID=2896848 RepID=UPI001E657D62|nr:hypothetical protein [Yinghuangia sp. ASG 101]UGQ15196.1 hypothetical protein LO772_17495 [Yinghuangia sp. ASG 101]